MSNKNERRDFLKGAFGMGVVAQIPTATLVTGLLNGLMSKAYALEQNPADLLNYVGLWMNGGIERWYFDSMMAPNGLNPGINLGARKNKIKNRSTINGKTYIESLEYALTAQRVNGKIYLPHLWESTLPGLSGNVSMKELATNMISIRGVDTGVGFDAHGNNDVAAENAFGYPTSISGLAGSISKFPFSAAHSGVNVGITSPRSAVAVDVENISPTLKKFSLPSTTAASARVVFKTNEIRTIVDDFIKTFARSLPPSKQKAAQALMTNREAAKNMFDFVAQSYNNIQLDYNEAYEAYSGILMGVSRNHLEGRALAGFDDQPIHNPGREASFSNAKKGELTQQFNDNDLVVFMGGNFENMIDHLSAVSFDHWARTLATVEVFLKYNITNSMKVACNRQGGPLGAPGDVHFNGENHRLLQHGKHYQALAAGLIACMDRLENIQDLQGKIVSSKTVFHLRSEFDREPTANGVGSNHHITGCTESFFSKMIADGPIAIGNIRTGNIGTGMQYLGGTITNYKHIHSTVQHISGVERDRNFSPLLERRGDTIVPLTKECKDVA